MKTLTLVQIRKNIKKIINFPFVIYTLLFEKKKIVGDKIIDMKEKIPFTLLKVEL